MRKMIKRWDFEESNRSKVVLGNGVRLDPEGFLELEVDDSGFRTDANLSAQTWLSTPHSAKRYIGFESFHVNRTIDLVQKTDVKFRVSRDGTEQMFWNGSIWTSASPGQWNTEAELADHLPVLALSAAKRGLQIIVNLSTTDPTVSPQVMYVKALYDSDVEWLEDLIARSLKPAIEAGVRPVAEAMVRSAGGTSVTLALEAGYDVQSIDTAYNVTTAPELITDIFQSYNPTTKVVTLSVSASANDKILIRFKYQPKVDLVPSQDVAEIATLPAISIGNIRATRTYRLTDHESVINKSTGQGWRLAGGEQSDIEVPISITTSKEKDVHRLSDEIQSFFRKNPLLTLKATDEQVRILIWEEHSANSYATMAGSHSASLRVRILNATFYRDDAEPVVATQHFQLSGTVNVNL